MTAPSLTGARGLRCARHAWRPPIAAMLEDGLDRWFCGRCGKLRDEERARRGRTARSKGNRRELEIAKTLGGTKVGQYGGPEDVRAGLFVVQSKVRKAFPYWMSTELAKLPRTDGRVPLLVVTDAPGVGHRRTSIAVVLLSDWKDLHGEGE